MALNAASLGGEVVRIDLNRPMSEILATLTKYPVKTRLSLTGTIIVARDLAHSKIRERLKVVATPTDVTQGNLGVDAAASHDRVVHRMGDVGYFDAEGRLWFCGRKSHRVETVDGPLYTEQVEPVFNTVAGVARTALVGVGAAGAQVPVLCVELLRGQSDSPALQETLRAHAATHAAEAGLQHFLVHPAFPVDIRHNAKIGREKLAVWASAELEKRA